MLLFAQKAISLTYIFLYRKGNANMCELFKNKNYSYFRAVTFQTCMNMIIDYIQKGYSKIIIWLFVPVVVITSFSHHRWVNPESIFEWDVKSYYAYLPATFIHNDLSLGFVAENPKEYGQWFWPVTTPIGKKCIVTSMGQSFMYTPFFIIAHGIAKVSSHEANGFTEPYAFAIHFSTLFYLILGLFFLRKLLLKYFNQFVTTVTIISVLLGTNLFYYAAYAAPMAHGNGFALISIFLYLVDLWYEKQTIKRTIWLGLLYGLIVLIRPTNILILIILVFWKTSNLKEIKERIVFLFSKYKMILLMMSAFILVWMPQLIYWKYVSGKFLYFSYEEISGTFYWGNPQLRNILVSFRKGWWIYTPLMFVASVSAVFFFRRKKFMMLSVLIFLLTNIYVQASWWCWWFGGSFGLRAFIDSYGIMALPIAVLLSTSMGHKKWRYAVVLLLGLLVWHNLFQVKQFNHQAIHYWWGSKSAYSKQLFKSSTVRGYWETIPLPDYPKARKGVYVAQNLTTRFEGYKDIHVSPEEILKEVKHSITEKPKHHKYAKRHDISVDSAITIAAWNKYELSWSIKEFVKPIWKEKMVDSLVVDTSYLEMEVPNWENIDINKLRSTLFTKVEEEIGKDF